MPIYWLIYLFFLHWIERSFLSDTEILGCIWVSFWTFYSDSVIYLYFHAKPYLRCYGFIMCFNISWGSVQLSSVAQSCPTLCDSMNRSTPGLPVHHQLPEFSQTHVHRVSDAIQPSHPLSSSPSPPAPSPSQHQSLFQWVNSSHEVAKVLEFQL